MLQFLVGLALILQGLANALPGMVTAEGAKPLGTVVALTALWIVAICGFSAAGLGVWGVQPFERRRRLIAGTAAIASLTLIAMSGRMDMWPGAAIDLMVLIGTFLPFLPLGHRPHHGWAHGLASALGMLSVLYVGLAVASRPWHHDWGATAVEIAQPLPGDRFAPNRRQFINHAITIEAPAEKVWPWIAQLGQDKAGFYSYDWLERLFGDQVHNVDHVVPMWQTLKEGDLVRSAQPGYLKSLLGSDPGWRVLQVKKNKALVLRGWGAFTLAPASPNSTRMIIRTHADSGPIWAAPFNLLVFEPIHFIMEQKMLRTIKVLAEHVSAADD